MMTKIEELNLSARSHNCLTRSNLKYLGEIVMMSEAELAKVKNLGKKSLEEIKQSLVDLGLGAGDPVASDIIEIFQKKLTELKG